MMPFLYNVYKSYRFGRGGHRRRPVGLRQLARVGDLMPAAAAQLHVHPRHPFGRPAFEYHYPHLLDGLEAEAHAGRRREAASSTVGSGESGRSARDTDPTTS